MDNKIVIGIVVLLVAGLGYYFLFMNESAPDFYDCGNDSECFTEHFDNCTPAKLVTKYKLRDWVFSHAHGKTHRNSRNQKHQQPIRCIQATNALFCNTPYPLFL